MFMGQSCDLLLVGSDFLQSPFQMLSRGGAALTHIAPSIHAYNITLTVVYMYRLSYWPASPLGAKADVFISIRNFSLLSFRQPK
jgi:hypothetical protein